MVEARAHSDETMGKIDQVIALFHEIKAENQLAAAYARYGRAARRITRVEPFQNVSLRRGRIASSFKGNHRSRLGAQLPQGTSVLQAARCV